MTIEEMQKARQAAEEAIRRALNEFMRASGLPVRDIQMELIETRCIGAPSEYRAGEIRLDVRL